MLWKQGEQVGSEGSKLETRGQVGVFLRTQGGFRDPGMLRDERSELGVRKESWGLPSLLAPTEVVGALKHRITIWLAPLTPAQSSSLPSLQFAPACSSLLQLTPSSLPSLPACSLHSSSFQLASACSPYSQLIPGTQGCSGSKGRKLGAKGAS